MLKKILILSSIVAFVSGLTYVGIGVWQLAQIDYEMGGYKIDGFRNSGSTTEVNPVTAGIVQVIKAVSTARYFDLDVTLKIKNISYLTVELLRCDFICYIQGVPVCRFKDSTSIPLGDKTTVPIKTPIIIEKESISSILLPISIDMKQSSKLFDTKDQNSFINLMASKNYDKVLINLQGSFTGSLLKIAKSINIDVTMTMQEIQDIMNAPSTGTKF